MKLENTPVSPKKREKNISNLHLGPMCSQAFMFRWKLTGWSFLTHPPTTRLCWKWKWNRVGKLEPRRGGGGGLRGLLPCREVKAQGWGRGGIKPRENLVGFRDCGFKYVLEIVHSVSGEEDEYDEELFFWILVRTTSRMLWFGGWWVWKEMFEPP